MNPDPNMILQLVAYGLIGLALLAGVIIAFREFTCWYLKINERLKLLRAIAKKLGAEVEYREENEKN